MNMNPMVGYPPPQQQPNPLHQQIAQAMMGGMPGRQPMAQGMPQRPMVGLQPMRGMVR